LLVAGVGISMIETSPVQSPQLSKHVPAAVLKHITEDEVSFLSSVFTRFNGYPDLQNVWQLMDEQWIAHGCDPDNMDERVTAFYQHPVWMLNGLFIEQDGQSLKNRQVFTDWVVSQSPVRVADFGGGFGGLARLVGQALPGSQVEVVDPHPHPAAISLAESTPNVRFVPALSGEYDLLIATDVFEHVPDPIGLAGETAAFLKVGGQYLIANCFAPVILCHLPQLFYLNVSWDQAMKAMGLEPSEKVQYGRGYLRVGNHSDQGSLDISAARQVADRGRKIWPWVSRLPRARAKAGQFLMKLLSR
jgi:hypothetical protein